MKRLFFGGVHPNYNKEMSTQEPSLQVITPKQVIIPMQQHIGVPCLPLVKVGDKVLRGQKVGDNEGMCVPVHASVSGTVVAVEERPHPTLGSCMAVVIENDFQDSAVPTPAPTTRDEKLNALREGGIVGMGGAAFPGNVKALTAMGKVEIMIANACECEPYITADDTLLRTSAQQVLEGMMILGELVEAERLVLAVEDNKVQAIETIRSLNEKYPKIELKVLPTRYPQGAEKQLVQAITGRQIPPRQLPISVGCAVFNVSTFATIFRILHYGYPLTQRIVTVSGEAIAEPQNFVVRIGTPFRDIIEVAGGLNDKTERVINGGPMMGVAQDNLDVPVVKATNSILCLLKDQNGAAENPVCLRCGKCVNVCPMHLQPLYLYRFANAGRLEELERLNLVDCMECGSCAFTCPGKLPLVEVFRKGKKMMKEASAK
ncbi:MAG: electron transport complex subunit RsxC [Oscillospiraceae bacterium]|nr:electron transport complex subunit RsxC [Oscillospiraceae bacterium]